MMIGSLSISAGAPLFIVLGALTATFWWIWMRRHSRARVPHSHGVLYEAGGRKGKFIQATILILAAPTILLLLFASLDPKLIETMPQGVEGRRILLVFDTSGSMTIGFDDTSSPLPSYEKTRMGRAGVFAAKLIKARRGDSFAAIFFDRGQYVARDFTTDTRQITELLEPIKLVSAYGLAQVPEAVRIKEDAEHTGTEAVWALEFANDFVLNHKDRNGKEIIVFVGDLETDLIRGGGVPDWLIPPTIKAIEAEGIPVYVIGIIRDPFLRGQEYSKMTEDKIKLFDGTGIPFYPADEDRAFERIAIQIANDIPATEIKENVIGYRTLAPWILMTTFLVLCGAVAISEKFPRIP